MIPHVSNRSTQQNLLHTTGTPPPKLKCTNESMNVAFITSLGGVGLTYKGVETSNWIREDIGIVVDSTGLFYLSYCGFGGGGGGGRKKRPYRSVENKPVPIAPWGSESAGAVGANFSIWEKVGWGALGTVALVGAGALALFPFDGPAGEIMLGAASLALFAKAGS